MTRPSSMVEMLALLGRDQRLTPQVYRAMLSDTPLPGSGFLRDPIQLIDRNGVSLWSASLQSEFAAARRDAPGLTIGQFLAGGAEGSLRRALVDALLGPASATMLRTLNPAEYVGALRQAFHEFRLVPTPFDGGVAYSPHRYQTGAHVALPEGLNVTPMNAPHGPDLHYPSYGPVVTQRGCRSIGMVVGSRAWGRDIPLDARGRTLFRELGLDSNDALHGWDYDPDLLLSEVQIAHMISTGEPPIYRFKILGGPPGPRAREQARWELAARLGDDSILDADEAGLQRLWDRYGRDGTRRTGDPLDLESRYARDPHYRFSRDELFGMALGRPDAPDVKVWVYEWEHTRPQRFIREMLAWTRRMRKKLPEDLWGSRLSMLTGASEPSNLQLLSPWAHARTDVVAGRMFGGVTRVDRFGNRAVPTLAEAEELVPHVLPGGGSLYPFPLTDIERADEALVAFDQHTLAELTAALHDDEWQAALRATAGVQEDWNRLVRRINTHLDAYDMHALFLTEI